MLRPRDSSCELTWPCRQHVDVESHTSFNNEILMDILDVMITLFKMRICVHVTPLANSHDLAGSNLSHQSNHQQPSCFFGNPY